MDAQFGYVFPVIRGVQAGREYFVSMCPLRLIPKIFLFDENEIPPEIRAQRALNRNRVPEIASYIVDNPEDYVFSALTASVDSEMRFEPVSDAPGAQHIGMLHIPMDGRFIINDGQHRRAAIEMALKEDPDLGTETIAVVFFHDIGLKRSQQMFADLNRYAVRPSNSIGVLYDHRDDKAQIARLTVFRSSVFRDLVELERSSLSPRSRKLFTLSAIYTAISALLTNISRDSVEELADLAAEYWEEVAKHMLEWNLVRTNKITAGEVRQDYIHTHSLALQALGNVGNALLREALAEGEDAGFWKERLKKLADIDWSRNNGGLWEGRALTGGKVTKSRNNVVLVTNVIKRHLDLPLTPQEQRLEDAFLRGEVIDE